MRQIKDMNVNFLVSVGSVFFSITTALIGGAVSYTQSVSEIKETIAKNYMPRSEVIDMIRHDLSAYKEDIQKINFQVDTIQQKQQRMELDLVKTSTEINVKLDFLMDHSGAEPDNVKMLKDKLKINDIKSQKS